MKQAVLKMTGKALICPPNISILSSKMLLLHTKVDNANKWVYHTEVDQIITWIWDVKVKWLSRVVRRGTSEGAKYTIHVVYA